MDENREYLNDFSIPNRRDEFLLDSEITGWQPFSTPNKFQMQKQCMKYCQNEHEPFALPHEQNQVKRCFTPSSDYRKTELPETVINTNFLSAIPYARQSKTVKRKLISENKRATDDTDTVQKPKTYFPFEFIGHAARESVSQENSDKENERFHNPTMVTGCALRKFDADGNISQTVFSTQNEPPLPPRKRAKKYSSKTKTNSVVALEQHFEQIKRKHAEFNWDVPDSQNTIAADRVSSTEVDIQQVPTTPFIEQYTSPSLYHTNERPLPTTMAWMPASRLALQNFEQRRNQRIPMDIPSNGELWSTSTVPREEYHNDSSGTANMHHLYPY